MFRITRGTSRVKRLGLFLLLAFVYVAQGEVVVFEAELFPEAEGWQRVGSGRAERSLEDGCFVQFVQIPGVLDAYQRSIADFAGCETFFV